MAQESLSQFEEFLKILIYDYCKCYLFDSAVGTFRLTMEFTEEYPNKPPIVKFVSKMFHPNGKYFLYLLYFFYFISFCSLVHTSEQYH